MRAMGLVSTAVLAVLLGAGIAFINLPSYGLDLPLLLLGASCVVVATLSIRTERNPLSPLLLSTIVFFTFYVMRPFYVLAAGVYGPARDLDDVPITSVVRSDMAEALWIALAGFLAFTCGYMVVRRRRRLSPADRRPTTELPELGLDGLIAPLLLLVTGVVAFLVYAKLIRDAGGVHGYIDQLSIRSGFFFGRAYLTAAVLPFKVVALTIVAVLLLRQPTRGQMLLSAGLLVAVGISDFLTGGRAAFVLGTALPVAALVHQLRAPLRLRTLVPIAIALAMFVVAARVVTRDSVYLNSRGQTRVQLVTSALKDMPKEIVGGRDVVGFDSLTTLVSKRHANEAPLLLGSTYLDTLAFPVPRALWHGKPDGGGNAWFTSHYFPAFYSAGHVETSVSSIGEAYLNFGVLGVGALLAIVGSLAAVLARRLDHVTSVKHALVSAVSLGYLLEWFRGDAYHSLSGWAMTVVLIQILFPLCVAREPVAARNLAPLHARPVYGRIEV